VLESNNIGQGAPAASLQMTYDEERGVHGGEYSVRPNMQESMIFLRKLFTHQQQEAGIVSFRNMLSPPDSPLSEFRLLLCFFRTSDLDVNLSLNLICHL
jgi:hypothetical protein